MLAADAPVINDSRILLLHVYQYPLSNRVLEGWFLGYPNCFNTSTWILRRFTDVWKHHFNGYLNTLVMIQWCFLLALLLQMLRETGWILWCSRARTTHHKECGSSFLEYVVMRESWYVSDCADGRKTDAGIACGIKQKIPVPSKPDTIFCTVKCFLRCRFYEVCKAWFVNCILWTGRRIFANGRNTIECPLKRPEHGFVQWT